MGVILMEKTHSEENLRYIRELLKKSGVNEFRFCVENDCYVCDRHGSFYSVCKRQYSKAGKLIEKYELNKLQGSVDKDGYTTYRITVDGMRKHLKGHRMMMNAWVGVMDDMVVNHKDGNKQNNNIDNLEWCTVAANNAHAIETGLFNPHQLTGRLRRVPSCNWMSIYIMHKHCGYSLSELGKMNGCAHDTIKKIIEKIDGIIPREVQNAG